MRLTEMLDDAFVQWADRTAFRVPESDETWSFEQVRVQSDAIAVGLQADGFGVGDAVAVLSPNSPDAFVAQLGILKAGAAYVPLNAKAALGDWVAVSTGAGATCLLYGEQMADTAHQLLAAMQGWKTVRGLEHGINGHESVREWITSFSGAHPARVRDGREDPCWIIGSGGTTGAPKAVVMPNRAMVAQTIALAGHMPDTCPVQLVSAPLTHAAGALTYPVLLQGGETVVFDGARPGELLRAIESYRITRLFMPPTAIYAMLARPDVNSHDYSSLRYFLYGSAPMSPSKLREAIDVFGPVMTQFYGQAEAPTICTWFSPREHLEAITEPSHAHRLQSVGRPSAVAAIRIIDKEGRPLPVGQVGEIAVRSDLQTLGYRDMPDESAALGAADGYNRTGDVGHIDSDGFVYISDRARDMIITGGFNVFPSEVERVIWTHPSVKDCAVVGRADDYWGEAVTAVVELKEGALEATDEILALCRSELGPVKTPKQVIYGVLPRSPVGKVLKRELRDRIS